MELKDYPNDPTITFIVENTPKDAVFLNSSYLYHPASLAGRKIYMGWPYFAWSAGYDTYTRKEKIEEIFNSQNKLSTCNLLKSENINYLTTQDTSNDKDFPDINLAFFENNFVSVHKTNNLNIYNVDLSCIK